MENACLKLCADIEDHGGRGDCLSALLIEDVLGVPGFPQPNCWCSRLLVRKPYQSCDQAAYLFYFISCDVVKILSTIVDFLVVISMKFSEDILTIASLKFYVFYTLYVSVIGKRGCDHIYIRETVALSLLI